VLNGTIEEIKAFGAGTAEIRIAIENQLLRAHVTVDAIEELGLTVGGNVYAMIKSVALGDSTRELPV
jgi:molybdopterin-binding protein